MSGTGAELPDLLELADRIRRRDISPVEVVESCLRRVESLNPTLNAYITVMAASARSEAAQAEKEIGKGAYRGPLHGVPLSIKDIYWTRGVRTTSGSRILAHFVADEDATVVARLRRAGAVILAKANTYQFASSPPHPDFGGTRNPWNLERTTRGSSCGSAASVAAGLDFGSYGSDTGGSIRVPSSFTGITGFKPSYGLVSRHRMQAVSWTLDFAGPMGRSVADVAALLEAVAGPDSNDPATLALTLHARDLGGPNRLDGLTVGILRDFMGDAVASDVAAAVESAAFVLGNAGATVRPFTLPGFIEEALAAHGLIMWSELAHVHRGWFPERAAEYTAFSQERLAAGRQIPAIDYLHGLDERRRLQARMADAMSDFDLLVLPTAPMVATLHEDLYPDLDRTAELTALGQWNSPFNLTGQPALTVPCGFSEERLPIGLQIVGRFGADALVLKAGKVYQSRSDWHRRHPSLLSSGPSGAQEDRSIRRSAT
jgi:aspartyl-tRNA(Asn)/glutamyl-tRNA(Gln) amidotransferase subunit A